MDRHRADDLDARAHELSARVDTSRALTALRAGVLGGRGPGADEAEIDLHTRRRGSIAGQPVILHLEETARRAEEFRATG